MNVILPYSTVPKHLPRSFQNNTLRINLVSFSFPFFVVGKGQIWRQSINPNCS